MVYIDLKFASNKDPRIVCHYFLDTVESVNGIHRSEICCFNY